ncbi:hypothetical protein [Candidatus Dactylopiibacterium carminicum]|uniref:hypothetical protein n=1 Tax=Candidatus Dactylopiibacterium carminicum TaxID=857335 RepID=UPI001481F0A4|nr:hypothetical protein [Candidatus Dactylopiibacterium carminicum]
MTEINIGTGVSALTLLDGATILARGTNVPEGSKAYVRAGLIEGPAPDLAEVEIVV